MGTAAVKPTMKKTKKKRPQRRGRSTAINRLSIDKDSPSKSKRKASKHTIQRTAKRLGIEYAAARGMVGQFLEKLVVKCLTPDETARLETYTAAVPALQIVYHDIRGRIVKGYWRIRYLEPVYDRRKKLIRFTGPREIGPYLYFARTWPRRLKGITWPKIAGDVSIPIFFTEGELKACALARIGRAAIGLAGVYSFLKNGKLLPEFTQIDWVGRYVYIIFDNDIVHKPDVRRAMGRLVHELTQLGSLPRIINLPDFELVGKKVGVDDYLVEQKFRKSSLDELEVELCEETVLLHYLNSRVAYIRKLKAFWDFECEIFYRIDELNTAFAPLTFWIDTSRGKRQVSATKEWIKWSRRAEYDEMVYMPGEAKVVGNKLNIWKGWGVDARKGNERPVLELIRYLLAGCPEQMTWFLQWLAYPIQYPGTKLYTSVLLWSSAQGVGKSLLAEIMGDIYGENYAEISRDNLTADFNSWAKHKQFIQGDEITGSDSRARSFADKLKAMITRQSVEINEKYAPQFSLADRANYFFTSNHVDALFLEDRDRRFFVVEVSKSRKSDTFYEKLRKWRDKPGPDNPNGQFRGPMAFRWYLENEVELGGFNPFAEPPVTQAKLDMQDLSLSDLNRFTRMLRDDPDSVLRRKGGIIHDELFELNTLILLSKRGLNDKGIQSAMSKALRNAGFRKRQVRVGTARPYLWAIRNSGRWWKRRPAEWAAQYTRQIARRERELNSS